MSNVSSSTIFRTTYNRTATGVASSNVPQIAAPAIPASTKKIEVLTLSDANIQSLGITGDAFVAEYKIAVLTAIVCLGQFNQGDMLLSWILSIFNLLNPHFFTLFADPLTQITPVRREMNPDFLKTIHGVVDGNPVATEDWEVVKDTTSIWAGITAVEHQKQLTPPHWEVYTRISIIVYAFNKVASSTNYPAFTTNRPRAAAGIAGSTATEGGILDPTRIHSIEDLGKIRGCINLHPGLRRVLCTELIKVGHAPIQGPWAQIIGSTARLWAGNGLSHVQAIRDLISGYAEAIETIGKLATEATVFLTEDDRIRAQGDPFMVYDRAIKGNQSQIYKLRDYPELSNIAIILKKRETPSMVNFNPTMRQSTYLEAFEIACKSMSLYFPAAPAAAV